MFVKYMIDFIYCSASMECICIKVSENCLKSKEEYSLFVFSTYTDGDTKGAKSRMGTVLQRNGIIPHKDKLDNGMWCSSKYVMSIDLIRKDIRPICIYIAILPENTIETSSVAITDCIQSLLESTGNQIIQQMLFLLDKKITSRQQLQHHIEKLIDANPNVSRTDESRGCRIFHDTEKSLTKRVSILQHRQFTQMTQKASEKNGINGIHIANKMAESLEVKQQEIPHEVQTSVSRIPGVKSYGMVNKKFEITVKENIYSTKDVYLTKLQNAVGEWRVLSEENIRIQKEGVQWHYDTLACRETCYGKITVFLEHKSREKVRLAFLAPKHVIPETKMEVYAYENQNHEHQLAKGMSLYVQGVDEENPEFGDDSFVDTTCVLVNEADKGKFSTSVPGIRPDVIRKITPFEGGYDDIVGMCVVKPSTEEPTYGTCVGYTYLTPAENNEEPRRSACGHNHEINIPFGHNPRKVDLIQSDEERPFGVRGDSGALVSLFKSEREITPIFVYMGKFSTESDNLYMVCRLQSAVDSLQKKCIPAELLYIFDDAVVAIH